MARGFDILTPCQFVRDCVCKDRSKNFVCWSLLGLLCHVPGCFMRVTHLVLSKFTLQPISHHLKKVEEVRGSGVGSGIAASSAQKGMACCVTSCVLPDLIQANSCLKYQKFAEHWLKLSSVTGSEEGYSQNHASINETCWVAKQSCN